MIVCGCDPGLDGALAFLDPETRRIVSMIGMPTLQLTKSSKGTKREISARSLVVLIERQIIAPGFVVGRIFIERVSASPQMGVTSAFRFGEGYGEVKGIIAALGWPVEYVTAAKWKREMRAPADKDDARMRACQLMPEDAHLWTPARGIANKAQCSGMSEAALIAYWGAQTLGAAGPGELRLTAPGVAGLRL